jgi:RNA polymerase sigma factor (sigma-70 family)
MTTREQLLQELRPASFAIAYRMLGSVSEAEDVVQEALLRLDQAIDSGHRIATLAAFVTTVTTRLAIDELRSARARREQYVGEWLPEPILTDELDDPERQAEMADSLSVAMLVLLESLSPEQRAAFLLHDVFDYGYEEIARIVGKNEDNVRQLATRARRHATPPAVSDLTRATRGAGASLLRRRSGRRSRRTGGAARPRRRADRGRRRQGSDHRALGAWPRCGRKHAARLDEAPRASSRRVDAVRRGQRRPWSAGARRAGPVHCRLGTRHLRR